MTLNEEQEEAIAFDANTWVSAGAGSGKTRTLVELYVRLLGEGPPGGRRGENAAPRTPERLVAMTFTEKAAAEMKDRIRQAIDERVQSTTAAPEVERWTLMRRQLARAPISTIHSFCAAILRDHPAMARVDPSFVVLEEREATGLFTRALESIVLGGVQSGDPAVTRLVDLYGLTAGELGGGGLLEAIARLYREMVQAGLTVSDCRARVPQAPDMFAPALEAVLAAVSDLVQTCLNGSSKQRHDITTFLPRWSRLKEGFNPAQSASQNLRWLGRLDEALQGRKRGAAWNALRDAMETAGTGLGEALAVPVTHDLLTLVERVEQGYVAAKNRQSGLDFEDLQVKARNLLRDVPTLRRLYQEAWDVVMVDEYQDTNPLQDSLVQLLCEHPEVPGEMAPRKLFMVGDPKQSIYGFRGADVSVFTGWRSRLPKVCHLQSNYRSVPAIVEFVNRFFADEVLGGEAEGPLGAAGWQVRFHPEDAMKVERGGDGSVQVLAVERGEDELTEAARSREAALLADHVWQAVAGPQPLRVAGPPGGENDARPARWGDCAMLFRVTSHIKVYEHELRRRNIPYYVVKGQGFFECQEIKDVVNVLAWLDDPQQRIALVGFLRSPMVGLSDDSLLRLAAAGSFTESVPLGGGEEDAAFERARAWLTEWRELRDRLAPSELVERIVRSTGYLAAVVPLFQGSQKVANVRKLVDLARDYEEHGPYNFRGFVRWLTTLIDEKAREPEYPVWAERADVVRLMSVHQSKGLQFPIVYVPQMGRENRLHPESVMFHAERGVAVKVRVDKYHKWLKPPAFLAAEAEQKSRELEESRRLLYVALTRAADHLVMSGELRGRGETWAGWLGHWLEAGDRGVRVLRRADVEPARIEALQEAAAADPEQVAEAEQRVATWHPSAPHWLVLSVRELAEYLVCPRRHYYAGVLSMEETPPRARVAPAGALRAADRGQIVHRALETLDFTASPAEVQKSLRRLVGGEAPELGRLARDVSAFLASATGEALRQARQVSRELPLYLTLQASDGWTLQISGVADLVFEDVDGRWHVLDYKQSRLGRGRLPLYLYQLKIYAAALMAGLQLDEVVIGLRFLEERKPSIGDQVLTRADVARLEANAVRAGRQLAASSRTLTEEAWPKVVQESRCHDLECGFRWRCGRLPVQQEQLELALDA